MSAAAMAMPRPRMKSIFPKPAPPEPNLDPKWGRGTALALAFPRCSVCRGSGHAFSAKMRVRVCNCVLRSIFRIYWNKFLACMTQEKYLSRVSLEPHCGRSRPTSWGRKDEEFIADFMLVSRRTLEAKEYRLFRLHFLMGADWRICARETGIGRGNFFHAVYRIEQKLGRVFRELEPYALFPVDEYYHGPSIHTRAFRGWSEPRNGMPVRPPLARI